jgi:hypothetical protein
MIETTANDVKLTIFQIAREAWKAYGYGYARPTPQMMIFYRVSSAYPTLSVGWMWNVVERVNTQIEKNLRGIK